jgi:hypothetical protein
VHLLRNSFRYASRQHWDAIATALKPVYTAATEAAARERFSEFTTEWGARYPAIVRLWDNAWAEFVPFLAFDPEIRRVICSTNAIESVNARIRRAVKARGHFPNEQAALKCVYMAVMSLDPTGTGRKRWMTRWKPALNAFEIAFDRPPGRRSKVSSFNPSYTARLTHPCPSRGSRVVPASPGEVALMSQRSLLTKPRSCRTYGHGFSPLDLPHCVPARRPHSPVYQSAELLALRRHVAESASAAAPGRHAQDWSVRTG